MIIAVVIDLLHLYNQQQKYSKTEPRYLFVGLIASAIEMVL